MSRKNADARRCSYFELGLPVLIRGIQVNQSCVAYSEPPNQIKVLVEAKFKRACGFVIPWILLSVATHEQIPTNQSRFTMS